MYVLYVGINKENICSLYTVFSMLKQDFLKNVKLGMVATSKHLLFVCGALNQGTEALSKTLQSCS